MYGVMTIRRMSIVVDDCRRYIVCVDGRERDCCSCPQVRFISNHHLSVFWDARDNILFSGLVLLVELRSHEVGQHLDIYIYIYIYVYICLCKVLTHFVAS